MNQTVRILYVDDNPHDRELVRDALAQHSGGFQLTQAGSAEEFQRRLAEQTYDLVLSDFNIRGFEGLAVLEIVKARSPGTPVVIVTGTGSEEVAVEAMKRGAADYVIKTIRHLQRLPHTIEAVLQRRRMEEEKRRMEDELVHMARLSTMGEMVAGIAHEMSQPLQAIANFGAACQATLAKPEPHDLTNLRQWTDGIVASANRATAIVRQFKEFAGKVRSSQTSWAMDEVAAESVRLVQFEARRCRVVVDVDARPPLPAVKADRVQIQQVLINLLQNAFDAMRDDRITLRRVTIRLRCEGAEVEVSVADTGPGVSPEIQPRIFEPFATNKPHGMGMGLAISRTIVERHGGRLWAVNIPEGGADFRFTLPLAQPKD